jgi:hypothetical protein
MQEEEKELRHRLLNDLVLLEEACVAAYLAVAGPATAISEAQRNRMAEQLSRVLTIFRISDDHQDIRPLSAVEMRGGTFVDSGRVIIFKDGRAPITRLAVTRTSLKSTLHSMARSRKR